jgi:hypothetical protein
MSKRIKISNISQDKKNFNRHTPQGMELLKKSIEKVGVIESITVSSDDVIISGNARHEIFEKIIGDKAEPVIVETDGTHPIIIKRTDINSGTKQFHEAALLANTTAKQNISLDIDMIQEVAVNEYGIDLIEVGVIEAINNPHKEFEDFGDFKYVNDDCTAFKRLIVDFDNETDFKNFCNLTGLAITLKTRSVFYPQKEKEVLQDYEHEQR